MFTTVPAQEAFAKKVCLLLSTTVLLFVGGFVGVVCIGDTPAAAATWTDTDWSDEHWTAIDSIDADSTPGELVLLANTIRFIPAFDATDYDGVWAMAVWRDQLYLGAGDNPPMMTNGGEILVYDYANDSCDFDYAVWEQGIAVLKVHDDILFSPGVDSQAPSHHFGNIYYNDGSGWVRKETVPSAAHVFDICFRDDKLWVTSGLGLGDNRGVLYSSADMGDTWTEEFAVDLYPPNVLHRRLYAATEFGGSIFVQSDFEEPEEFVLFELKPDQSVVEHDILGYVVDTHAGFTVYRDQLYCLLPHAINVFDGVSFTGYDIPVGSPDYVARAMAVFHDRLYVGGNQAIAITEDAQNWSWTWIEDNTGRVFESLQMFHGRLYAGSYPDGEVYVSAVPPGGTLDSAAHCFALPVAWGALSWEALTPGTETAVKFQLRSAADETALPSATFVGPDGTAASWYLSSGTAISPVHHGHSCFQYRVRLESSDERLGPVLQQVELEVEDITAAPDAPAAGATLAVWPNPFNPRTTIHYALPRQTAVELTIYDVLGRRVTTLVRGAGAVGDFAVNWDGTDRLGRAVPDGVYFALLTGDGIHVTQRMVLLR